MKTGQPLYLFMGGAAVNSIVYRMAGGIRRTKTQQCLCGIGEIRHRLGLRRQRACCRLHFRQYRRWHGTDARVRRRHRGEGAGAGEWIGN